MKARKYLIFPTPPFFDAPLGRNPLEFLHGTYPTNTRGMGVLYGKNFMILSSTVYV